MTTEAIAGERAELVETLRKHRALFLFTCQGLSEEQSRQRSTVSALTLASLVKHVSDTEEGWARFATSGSTDEGGQEWVSDGAQGDGQAADGAAATPSWEAEDFVDPRFVIAEGETLAGLMARYEQVASATDELVATLDLDLSHPLPSAPWFEPGASWSARRVFLHIIAETAQHAGHADIIRESIDGQKSMG